ncbi:MAG: ArsB/NhaD family transporter [Chloroflexia bacterium]|nr:ArsB/NhaD family transporter [Chloroflexia bacterium]
MWPLFLLALGLLFLLSLEGRPEAARAQCLPALSGRVTDSQGQVVRHPRVLVYLDGQAEPYAEVEGSREGSFIVDLPEESFQSVHLDIHHPHFKPFLWDASWEEVAHLRDHLALRLPDIVLERQLTAGFWIASLTFVGMLVLVATERLHGTMAALLGVAVILGVSLVGRPLSETLFILDFEQAIEYVNFDVIFLVMGMMIVIAIIEETGIFQWLAYQAYRLSRGRVWLLVTILMLLTSVASALLDNVTTMLLVAPITLQIALTLGVDPLSLLIPEMLASNVGGISTLIGTPNNILIGSAANITFNDFLRNQTIGVLMAQVVLTVYVLLVYRKQHRAAGKEVSPALLQRLRENARISQPDKLRRAGIVFGLILVLFVVGERFHLVPAVTAILGAVAMLLVVQAKVEDMMRVVDWTTLMFFIALFIVVGAIQEVGLISYMASAIQYLVGDNLVVAILGVAWSTALLCLLIPTIPLTAALLPVVQFLSRSLPGAASSKALFYSLSVGSALGANSSLVGATNNMVTASIAERAGFPIRYGNFLKVGLPGVLITMIVGSLWLLIRF